MCNLGFSRCAGLGISVAAAMLTACGGSQPPIAPGGALPQTSAVRARADLGRSRMLPEAKREALLYASSGHGVDVFSYPAGRPVGKLRIGYNIGGLCSDPKGEVFVDVFRANGEILEYEHGGTEPIATIKSEFGFPLQCAFDPTTGNLAVIDTFNSGPENVAIYQNGTGNGKSYEDYGPFYSFNSCAYDGSGNLFVSGYSGALGELPKGAGAFINYKPALKTDESVLAGIQWDGTYVTIQELPPETDHALLDRITIAHKEAKVVSRTKLAGNHIRFKWLYSGAAIGLEGQKQNAIGFWPYPAGGRTTKVLSDHAMRFGDATISVAP
jgi:hypothetical protein